MEARKRRKKKSPLVQAVFVAAVFLGMLLFLSVIGRGSEQGQKSLQQMAEDPALSQGISYLSLQEQKTPDAVEAKMKEEKLKELRANLEAERQKLISGEADVWTLFEDYALMGDSRAFGFWYYDYMPGDRVFAEGGAKITWVEERIEELKLLNPSRVFLCFGLNDTGIGFWKTPKEYAAVYQETLEFLKRELPGATPYVNSILIARDPAFEQNSDWHNIPAYSNAVKEMCEREGYIFIDNSNLEEQYPDLWDPDGIHLRRAFYPYWATNMILKVYEVEQAAALEEEAQKEAGNE